MSQTNKNATSVHRIFVGGLFTGITEEDLTSRLDKFGTIKNVYIHERQNDQGDITKTFAEVDMETSERNLSRCFSAYSNTIWKGHTMRLQKYKEDPFERTRKTKEPRKNLKTEQSSDQFSCDHDNLNSPQFTRSNENSQHLYRPPPRIKQEHGENLYNTSSKVKQDSIDTYQNKVTRVPHEPSTQWNFDTIPAGPRRSQNPHRSTTKSQHANDSTSSSESEDEPMACQGVPKFGGIFLESNAKAATKKLNVDEASFSIVSNRYKNAKPIHTESDSKSNATDEIIAVSNSVKKEISTSEPVMKSSKTDRQRKKHLVSTEYDESNMNSNNTHLNMKQVKSTPMGGKKTQGTSKGVLGRLEGFSSVWQDGSDDEDSEWKNKLERAGSSKFKLGKDDGAGVVNRSQSHEYERAMDETSDHKLVPKLKRELPTSEKFSPVNYDSKLTNQQEAKVEQKYYSVHPVSENKEKHTKDNYKRLESMKKMQSALAEQKKAIGAALSIKRETCPTPNKKIKFDSDGEEGLDGQRENIVWDLEKDFGGHVNTADKPTQSKKSKKEKHLHLFDDEDNDGENEATEDNFATMFDVRPQFEGAAGEKLFKLQSRFGDDKRFTVDQRFLEEESSSGIESDSNKNANEQTSVEEFEDEKSRHLQILQNVIGNDVGFKSRNKSAEKGNTLMMRYDPSKQDHDQFEIKVGEQDKSSAKPKKPKKTLPAEPEPLPEVSKETFYEVSHNLKNIFEKKTSDDNTSFSLLKALGRDNDETNDKLEQTRYNGTVSTRERKTKLLGESAFKYDSSDDEDQSNEIQPNSQEGSNETGRAPFSSVDKQQKTFFFQSNDQRLSDSVSFFCRTEPLDVLQKRWKEVRHALYEDLLTKSKRSVRRKTPKKEKKGSMPKRRFKPSTKKQYK